MVYETDFYTTRRPYRASPSLSTYTVTSEPSRQIRILPGLGKVHVVHSYDRIIPYIGHKRLTVVTQPPITIRVRPSTLYREFDRIENKLRPYTYNSYTNDYLNSDSHVRIVYVRNPISGSYPIYSTSTLATRYYDPYYYSSTYYPTYLTSLPWTYYPSYYTPTRRYFSSYNLYPSERWLDLALYPTWKHTHFARMFDDESRAIRAQAANLLNQIHTHVPRRLRAMHLPYVSSSSELPARWSNDNYVKKMIVSSPSSKSEYTTYWSDPVKKQFCHGGRLACVTIVGNKGHPRRKNIYEYYDDPVRSDIQLLSYYINRFREERKVKNPISVRAVLPPLRPSRVFSVPRPLEDAKEVTEEMAKLKEERAARMAKIVEIKPEDLPKVEAKISADKVKKEAEAAEAKKKKKEEEEKAKAAAAAEEEARKLKEKEEAKKRKQQQEEEEAAAKKAAEEAKLKEEAAKKEKEAKEAAEKAAELERLAEQARQEELAKQAEIERVKKEEEDRVKAEEEKRAAEAAKAEEERQQLLRLEEIARQAEEEKEAELARQAEELAELARQEAELAEQAKAEEEAAEVVRKEAEATELAQKEAELAELETKEKELTEQAEQARAVAEEAAAELEAPGSEPTSPVQNEAPAEVVEDPVVEEPESPAPTEESNTNAVEVTSETEAEAENTEEATPTEE